MEKRLQLWGISFKTHIWKVHFASSDKDWPERHRAHTDLLLHYCSLTVLIFNKLFAKLFSNSIGKVMHHSHSPISLFTKLVSSLLETTKTTWKSFRAEEWRWAFGWTDTVTAKQRTHSTNVWRVQTPRRKTTEREWCDKHQLAKAGKTVAQEVQQHLALLNLVRWGNSFPSLLQVQCVQVLQVHH